MLKPLEVYSKKFEKSFRGYDEEKVDTFLIQVAKDYEELYEENMQIKETAEQTNSQLQYYQKLEKTLQNALMIAQKTAEEIVEKANNEKEAIIKEAQEKEHYILADVEKAADARREELSGSIIARQKDLAHIQANIQTYFDKTRYLLENQLRMLSEDDFVREVLQISVDLDLLKKPETILAVVQEEETETDAEENGVQVCEEPTETTEVEQNEETAEAGEENTSKQEG